jgi:outer membrane protein OmpA-like peptidoglycan-associated protein
MRLHWLLIITLLGAVLGCTAHERAILLPDQRGYAGVLEIKSSAGEATLDQPYSAADVYADGEIKTKVLDSEFVSKQYGVILSALPPRPISFTLYFIADSDELTPESTPVMQQIKAELSHRPYPEITVIGHTDTVGVAAYNDALSLKRAETVRQMLLKAGISAILIDVAGRGSRDLIIQTKEGVSEPLNRRVEINVR